MVINYLTSFFLSCLLHTPFNTHIRVLPITLIGVGHTLVWVSSNNLYMVYHRLIVLMLYILFSITIVDCRFRTTFDIPHIDDS